MYGGRSETNMRASHAQNDGGQPSEALPAQQVNDYIGHGQDETILQTANETASLYA